MRLKVGSVVRCVSHTYEGDSEYLTVGRNYEVKDVDYLGGFEIEFNNGEIGYCLTSECAHGEWELVEGVE